MKLVEKILMAVDVNRVCDEQIHTAIKIAKAFNSEVSVMYVLPEAKLYKIVGDEEQEAHYEKMAAELLRRLWDKKIEYEIRKHYKSNS